MYRYTLTIYGYRELYELNNLVPDLQKSLPADGAEIYALKPLGVGFLELEASTKENLLKLDQLCTSRIVSICKNHKIDVNALGPLVVY